MRNSLDKYTHFIWDWNGTILNDTYLVLEVFNELIGSLGHAPLSLEDYQLLFRHPIIEMYFELGVIRSEEEYMELSHQFHDLYGKRSRECSLHHLVLDCLDCIKLQGKTQSVLSALPQEMLDEIVDHHQLSPYFTSLLGHHSKLADSKIAYGRKWMQRQAFLPQETIMIGDTLHDVEVAEALGIDCLILPNGYQHSSAFDRNLTRMLKNFSELLAELAQ
ncbi:MAG: HAD family hydrolase [Bdellovibrionales bacterium]|nr:HAD family hydrolase [Bdellovibrionales bacterium]